jgi:hypothetical protein
VIKSYNLNNGEQPPKCTHPQGHKWEEQNSYEKTMRGDHFQICPRCKVAQFYDSSD